MPASLHAILENAFALLSEGVETATSPFRTPTLASVAADGSPRLRSVVLRGFENASRTIEMHSDTRSSKVAEFARMPASSLHVWDPARRVQLRLRGRIALHTGDALAASSWSRLPATSRSTYQGVPGPGTPIESPHDKHASGEDAGFSVFCAMLLPVDELEWLHLEHGSYKRARFRWDNGALSLMWLVP